MAIAALVLWILTAGAGVSLLGSLGTARRLATGTAQPAQVRAAVPLTADGAPPPVPRARVASPPGEHPLLEFAHPALAVTGLGCWLGFVFVGNRALAWTSLGLLLATLAAGLSWLARSALAGRRQPGGPRSIPARLIAFHGVAAAGVLALTVLAALSASHG